MTDDASTAQRSTANDLAQFTFKFSDESLEALTKAWAWPLGSAPAEGPPIRLPKKWKVRFFRYAAGQSLPPVSTLWADWNRYLMPPLPAAPEEWCHVEMGDGIVAHCYAVPWETQEWPSRGGERHRPTPFDALPEAIRSLAEDFPHSFKNNRKAFDRFASGWLAPEAAEFRDSLDSVFSPKLKADRNLCMAIWQSRLMEEGEEPFYPPIMGRTMIVTEAEGGEPAFHQEVQRLLDEYRATRKQDRDRRLAKYAAVLTSFSFNELARAFAAVAKIPDRPDNSSSHYDAFLRRFTSFRKAHEWLPSKQHIAGQMNASQASPILKRLGLDGLPEAPRSGRTP